MMLITIYEPSGIQSLTEIITRHTRETNERKLKLF